MSRLMTIPEAMDLPTAERKRLLSELQSKHAELRRERIELLKARIVNLQQQNRELREKQPS